MKRAQIESLGYSLLALVLVIVFIQTIGVWRWLSEELGKTGSLPAALVQAKPLSAKNGNSRRASTFCTPMIMRRN